MIDFLAVVPATRSPAAAHATEGLTVFPTDVVVTLPSMELYLPQDENMDSRWTCGPLVAGSDRSRWDCDLEFSLNYFRYIRQIQIGKHHCFCPAGRRAKRRGGDIVCRQDSPKTCVAVALVVDIWTSYNSVRKSSCGVE